MKRAAERLENQECLANLGGWFARLQIDDKAQTDAGGARKLILAKPLSLSAGSDDCADFGGRVDSLFHIFPDREISMRFARLSMEMSRSGYFQGAAPVFAGNIPLGNFPTKTPAVGRLIRSPKPTSGADSNRALRHAPAPLTSARRTKKRRADFYERPVFILMSLQRLQSIVEQSFEDRASVNSRTAGEVREAVNQALGLLDSGELRVAEKIPGATGKESWRVHQWLKKAVLLSFRLNENMMIAGGPGGGNDAAAWYDKVASKFAGWDAPRFAKAGFRAVPGSIVRHSAFIAPNVVLMPSFVNVGAHVGANTMVDTWVTVGSCAQIGKNVHLSGGVGIGGVLEPLQANPTIIEDDCFIGARSEIVEGVIVGEGSVVSMGVFISASTKIVDRATGKIHVGHVPPYSVVVSGSTPGKPLPDGSPGPSLYCAVIVKTVDAQTRAKTGINELLRD